MKFKNNSINCSKPNHHHHKILHKLKMIFVAEFKIQTERDSHHLSTEQKPNWFASVFEITAKTRARTPLFAQASLIYDAHFIYVQNLCVTSIDGRYYFLCITSWCLSTHNWTQSVWLLTSKITWFVCIFYRICVCIHPRCLRFCLAWLVFIQFSTFNSNVHLTSKWQTACVSSSQYISAASRCW